MCAWYSPKWRVISHRLPCNCYLQCASRWQDESWWAEYLPIKDLAYPWDEAHSMNCVMRLDVMRPPSCSMHSGHSTGQLCSLSSRIKSLWLTIVTPCCCAAATAKPAIALTCLPCICCCRCISHKDGIVSSLTSWSCFNYRYFNIVCCPGWRKT